MVLFVISIHALREEGDAGPCELCSAGHGISIHALREEGDHRFIALSSRMMLFLSTPSARRATSIAASLSAALSISIHALREEGDGYLGRCISTHRYFYPRPPRGGRLNRVITSGQHSQFLSTPSARRATNMTVYLTELILDFYPRPPRGGRLAVVGSKVCSLPISIHALREEGDRKRQSFSSAG